MKSTSPATQTATIPKTVSQTVAKIPLALYIHIPWCVKKCPYCDFNSHQMNKQTDFAQYVDVLIADARSQLGFVQSRQISSVFIGGGTPSLLPVSEYQRLFDALRQMYSFADDVEVTMEANPATIEHAPFEQYLEVGINRLSIGVQTFHTDRLQTLGRIHDDKQAVKAIESAKRAGFKRINVDLMHGLPKQSVQEAIYDIHQAVKAGATHISWYQLTIEPDTVFYRTNPRLPNESVLGEIEEQGGALLREYGFVNYEVSAWHGANDKPCRHNVNYWQFGDYLAIGAGAHGKVTVSNGSTDIAGADPDLIQAKAIQLDAIKDTSDDVIQYTIEDGIYRFSNPEQPRDYLKFEYNPHKLSHRHTWQAIGHDELIGEFMLDGLRLTEGVAIAMLIERTGQDIFFNQSMQTMQGMDTINKRMKTLKQQGLLVDSDTHIIPTELGRRYLNRVLEYFI